MSQSDQTVQNATFPAVRADINDNLAALFSQSSGPSAPAVTVAYQPWIDTSLSPAVWKIRNGTNSGWVTIGTIDLGGFAVGGVTPIANGGTGQITAAAAINALLPSQTGNSGKGIITDGTNVSWGSLGSPSKTLLFTSSGTWLCPDGVTFITVTVIGGGGGGIKQSFNMPDGNGGRGGIGVGCIAVTPGSTYTITVGAGGAGNNSGNGGNGGDSSFSTVIIATGGQGSFNNSSDGYNGTCTSAAADIRRGTIEDTSIPYCPFIFRRPTASLAAIAYSVTSIYLPGSGGVNVSGGNAGGGVGGAIFISY